MHRVGAALYAAALVVLLVAANLKSATNLVWLGILATVLVVSWWFARRSTRDGLIVVQLLMASPFAYACLLSLAGAGVQLQRGGLYTRELVTLALAGGVAMGTFAGYFASRAVRMMRTPDLEVPESHPAAH